MDPITAMGIGGAAASAVTGLLGTGLNYDMSKQNLKFQKEQFAYQKELNDKYMERMDNKLNYMVKDAKNSGINPLAALGTAGGYSPTQSAQAPQMDTSWSTMLGDVGKDAVNSGVAVAKVASDNMLARSQNNINIAQAANITQDEKVKKELERQLKHNTDYADVHNIPANMMASWKDDLYSELKPYLVGALRRRMKNVQEGVDNIDNVVSMLMNAMHPSEIMYTVKGGVKLTKEFVNKLVSDLRDNGVEVTSDALRNIMDFIINTRSGYEKLKTVIKENF